MEDILRYINDKLTSGDLNSHDYAIVNTYKAMIAQHDTVKSVIDSTMVNKESTCEIDITKLNIEHMHNHVSKIISTVDIDIHICNNIHNNN